MYVWCLKYLTNTDITEIRILILGFCSHTPGRIVDQYARSHVLTITHTHTQRGDRCALGATYMGQVWSRFTDSRSIIIPKSCISGRVTLDTVW